MQRELGIHATLIKGRGGVFEVRHGQELVFSKRESRRFPAPGEVVDLLRERGKTAAPGAGEVDPP